MKELQIGQKVVSIQLGYCEVVEVRKGDMYPIICENNESIKKYYTIDGYHWKGDKFPSLFESNPFERSVDANEPIEPKLVRQQNDGWVENKAELINALVNLINSDMSENLDNIAETKLQKLLESI